MSVGGDHLQGRRATVAFLVASLTAASLGVVPAPEAAAHDTAGFATGGLAVGVEEPAAVWTGETAYVFGGRGGSRLIQTYDPDTGASWVVDALLPDFFIDRAAVWDGRDLPETGCAGGCAYLFQRADAWRYHPASGTVTVLEDALETGFAGTVVWTGQYAFSFGGTSVGRWDPVTGEGTVMNATFPEPITREVAAYDGTHAYIFPGLGPGPCPCGRNDIYRYDPVTDTLALLDATTPQPMADSAALWNGEHIYLFGDGWDGDEIVRFTPATEEVVLMEARLPGTQANMAAILFGENAVLFGAKEEVYAYPLAAGHPVADIQPVDPVECVDGRATVLLDGSGSFDPNGVPLTFRWSSLGGMEIDDPTAPVTTASLPFGATRIDLRVEAGARFGVTSRVMQVVDTIPPDVNLSRPRPGHLYVNDEDLGPHGLDLPDGMETLAVGGLTLVAEAGDRCGIGSVTFAGETSLGFRRGATVTAPPYTYLYQPIAVNPGPNTVTAVATDLAGHEIADSVTYVHGGDRLHAFLAGRCIWVFVHGCIPYVLPAVE